MPIETAAVNRTGTVTAAADHPVGFYRRRGKRIVDFIAAGFALVVISPLMVLISVAIKLTSHGPIFYIQNRVGKDGRLFRIIKFRSMVVDADRKGPGITCAGDPRITGVGRLLRKLKLDELPQLWNVLRGDMSLVGPRPELPTYVATYDQRQRAVLNVRPGITDTASIAYRWEEELLSQQPSPDKFYQDVVLIRKLDLNLLYLAEMSFGYDCRLLFHTVLALVSPQSKNAFVE